MNYHDRSGKPIADTIAWAKLFEDKEYSRIAQTTLPNGKWVSTVWLGLNHNYGGGPPLIFETMVFTSEENLSELDCERYSTEADAAKGHEAMVEKWEKEGDSA